VSTRAIPLRLDASTIARLERLAAAAADRAIGAQVTRSSVMRAALDRGIAALERELLDRKARK